jgi:hypothetical protein
MNKLIMRWLDYCIQKEEFFLYVVSMTLACMLIGAAVTLVGLVMFNLLGMM